MFDILSLIFKYVFIIIIYMFIFSIIRLIYLDIRSMNITGSVDGAYIKLINLKESLEDNIREHYAVKDKLTLGRASSNDIIIKDPYISNKHFKIVKDEGEFYLEDLNSSNGTYVNDSLIEDVAHLFNGDRIRVGEIEFLFVNRE